ncbi:MAG: ion transporter [Planctomycetota bacterium]|nr:ion transporter [Planctomycetota bacterium]
MRDDTGQEPDDVSGPAGVPAGGAVSLDDLLDRLLAATGDSERSAPERATRLAGIEGDLLATLPVLAKTEPGFDGLKGHPTLADMGTWREELDIYEVDGDVRTDVQALVDDLMNDEVGRWRERAADVIDADDCYEMLAELTLLEREGLSRGCALEPLEAIRAPVRDAMVRAVAATPPTEKQRKQWATHLLDRADVVLTGIDDIAPDRAARHLALVADDILWHVKHIETRRGRARKRLLRKRARLLNEQQERRLQSKLEARFGTRGVARFERWIVFLIFFVLGSLVVEWVVELSDEVRIGLALADTFACCFFLLEFFVKLGMVDGKWRWFRRHFVIDFLPSLPFGLLVLGEMAEASANAGRGSRAIRLFRLFRLARYLRWLLPILRLLRAFGFLARGLDRLVRRYGHLLNRNIILYPNRRERAAAARETDRVMVRARRLRAAINRQWRELLAASPDDERAEVAAIRIRTVAEARAQGHTRRRRETQPATGTVRDIPAEACIDVLARMNPQELQAEMGDDFVERTSRVVRLFSRWPLRWIPVLRKYVPRLVPSMTEAEVVAAACHSAAKEMKRHHDRWFWFADLYGTVTPSEFVDRVGTAMVKGAMRPAYRLVIFGGFYALVQGLLSFATGDFLTWLSDGLKTFVGVPIYVLGGICLVVLGLGWWMRRIAGEATFFFEQTAKAQFLGLTETFKGRHMERDTRVLDRRVLAPEERVHGEGYPGGGEARRRCFIDAVRSWMVEAQSGARAGGLTEAMERVVLLYRDNLDGALFGESDTRTTNQLLGNPAIRQLRRLSDRIDKKERKALRILDLDRTRPTFRGPYIWFSYISKAVAQSAARLIVEYNRYAIPLDELPYVTDAERARYDRWIASGSILPGDVETKDLPARNLEYVTTAFTALHFLDDDPQRDREIAERFGMPVLTNLRSDRRLLFRRVFGTYPLHTRPKDQRVLNLYRVYESWLAGGRAFLVPFRMIGRTVRYIGSVVRWLIQSIKEIRRPKARHDVDLAAQADFATAVRKISRMRGPLVWACLWLRARFDSEYLGVRIPGGATWDGDDLGVWNDLRFLGAGPTLVRQIADERERAEWDVRRVAGLLKEGLLDDVAKHIGVDASRFGHEHVRAAVAVYRADMNGVRQLLSCEDILRETRIEAQQRPMHPLSLLPRPFLWLRFYRWWRQHGKGGKRERRATWRAIRRDQNESRQALDLWAKVGPEAARAEGTRVLADLLRHAGRLTEQLVTLRAVQTMSLIDLLNYREHVYRLGNYEASGDEPGEWLTFEGDETVAADTLSA